MSFNYSFPLELLLLRFSFKLNDNFIMLFASEFEFILFLLLISISIFSGTFRNTLGDGHVQQMLKNSSENLKKNQATDRIQTKRSSSKMVVL